MSLLNKKPRRARRRRRRLFAERLEDRQLLAATLDLVPQSGVGTVSEEGGTTVLTVAGGTQFGVSAQVIQSDEDVFSYALNFRNSSSLLLLDNFDSQDFPNDFDAVLNSAANDYFVSSGVPSGGAALPVPPPRTFGSLDVRAPMVAGDYRLTTNFTTGGEAENTVVSNDLGVPIAVTNFGDLIIRVTGDTGELPSNIGAIGGVSFIDNDGNRAFTSGVDTVNANIDVELLRNNTVFRTTTTNSDGSYRFDNLSPGTYQVRQDPLGIAGVTTPDPVTVQVVNDSGEQVALVDDYSQTGQSITANNVAPNSLVELESVLAPEAIGGARYPS